MACEHRQNVIQCLNEVEVIQPHFFYNYTNYNHLKYLHSPVVCLWWNIVKEKFIILNGTDMGHMTTDCWNKLNIWGLILSQSINIRIEIQFVLFSLGNKMPQATRKTLWSAKPFKTFTCDPWHFISQWKQKNVLQSLSRTMVHDKTWSVYSILINYVHNMHFHWLWQI